MTAVQRSNTRSVHAPSEKEGADAIRKEAVIGPLAEGAKLGRASAQAAHKPSRWPWRRAPPAARHSRRPSRSSLRTGALVLGRDPGVADQPAGAWAFCAPRRRHPGFTAVASPFYNLTRCLQTTVCKGGRDRSVPADGAGRARSQSTRALSVIIQGPFCSEPGRTFKPGTA